MNLDSDDFELFGLPRHFAQERAVLDSKWRELQAETHPDRFVRDGAAAQRLAMQWSVRINEAYQRLKDPLQRAAYLCELAGFEIGAENNTAMPSEFLERQMAWREALDEADDASALQSLSAEVAAHRMQLLGIIEQALDQSSDPALAVQQVRALMFVERFARDLDRRLEQLGL